LKPEKAVVHSLVLLSVVDHYNRVAKDTKKRVVGVLLGSWFRGQVNITNSYAVPFEEDPKTPNIWYIDHDYHENMYAMFKKVNAKEKVVGWYSTGPKIRPADLEINELFRRYTAEPILVIIDVNPKDDLEIPTDAYYSIEASPEAKSAHRMTFQHIPSDIGAVEAEEVGVEHLLRNIRDTSISSIADEVQYKLNSLKGLKKRLEMMTNYLDEVLEGKLTINQQILYNLQDMLTLLPDVHLPDTVQSFAQITNDNTLAVYLSSLIRSILALHNLINNKFQNRDHEKKLKLKEKEEKEKDKSKKEKESDKEKEKEKENDKEKEKDKESDKEKDKDKNKDKDKEKNQDKNCK